MRIKQALAALAAALALTSCALPQTSVDSLLTPPRLNEEQNEIYAALVRETGDDIKLLYPQRGDNRSAILVTNLDAEVTSEAVAFYQSTAANVSASIHMAVLDKQDGRWRSVHDLSLEGLQVEDVSVIRAESSPLLAVGLAYTSENASLLKVFRFNGSTMDETYSESYQVKAFGDMSSNDQDDIVLVSVGTEENPSSAKLITYENGRFREKSQVALDPSITRYARMTSGYLKNGRRVMYLDGYRGSAMTTEILGYGDSDSLQNLTYSPAGPKKYPVDRPAAIFCYDTNGDSVLEIPGLTLLPGYSEEVAGAVYLTDWYNFLEGDYQKLKSSYVNSAQGYMLDFPEKWVGKVSVRMSGRSNEMLFYEYGSEEKPVKSELLYIQMAKRSDWEAGKYKGYEVIESSGGGQILYLAKIPEDAEYPLRITMAEVKRNFSRYY